MKGQEGDFRMGGGLLFLSEPHDDWARRGDLLEETPTEGRAYVCAGGYVLISWLSNVTGDFLEVWLC